MKCKAIRLKTLDCDTFDPEVHVQILDGPKKGRTLHIGNAPGMGLDIEVVPGVIRTVRSEGRELVVEDVEA